MSEAARRTQFSLVPVPAKNLSREASLQRVCNALSLPADAIAQQVNDEKTTTEALVSKALQLVEAHEQSMAEEAAESIKQQKGSGSKVRLNALLRALLEHVPSDAGKRHVAALICSAEEDRSATPSRVLSNIAQAWLDHLLYPMLLLRGKAASEPSSPHTPTSDDTSVSIESATRSDHSALRKEVAKRENYMCAITGYYDNAQYHRLLEAEKEDEMPDYQSRADLEAAHIFALSLNQFDDRKSKEVQAAAITWDMIKLWTDIDLDQLVGPQINSAANAIYMTVLEHRYFGKFEFYLDKDAFPDEPHKYKALFCRPKRTFTNKQREAIVKFKDENPPREEYLRIHAAFAKVLHASGAADHFWSSPPLVAIEEGSIYWDERMDFGTALAWRLAAVPVR